MQTTDATTGAYSAATAIARPGETESAIASTEETEIETGVGIETETGRPGETGAETAIERGTGIGTETGPIVVATETEREIAPHETATA